MQVGAKVIQLIAFPFTAFHLHCKPHCECLKWTHSKGKTKTVWWQSTADSYLHLLNWMVREMILRSHCYHTQETPILWIRHLGSELNEQLGLCSLSSFSQSFSKVRVDVINNTQGCIDATKKTHTIAYLRRDSGLFDWMSASPHVTTLPRSWSEITMAVDSVLQSLLMCRCGVMRVFTQYSPVRRCLGSAILPVPGWLTVSARQQPLISPFDEQIPSPCY